MDVRIIDAFLADISAELWLCDCSLESPFRTCFISVGIEDWLISLNEARRSSTAIVEDIVDDVCSTLRVNSTCEIVGTPAKNTHRYAPWI